jgi:hypothetical protein
MTALGGTRADSAIVVRALSAQIAQKLRADAENF